MTKKTKKKTVSKKVTQVTEVTPVVLIKAEYSGFQQFLQLINGKKSIIVALLCGVVTYVQAKGYIDLHLAQLLQVFLGALSYQASKMTQPTYINHDI